MNKSIKYRLYPTGKQEELCNKDHSSSEQTLLLWSLSDYFTEIFITFFAPVEHLIVNLAVPFFFPLIVYFPVFFKTKEIILLLLFFTE